MRYFLYSRKSTEDEERQVLSLQSQQEALHRAFGQNEAIDIVETFEESKSAKTPGRPIFAQMLSRLEAGEADGIVSWAPDRLARNSVDGGRVIYLLDTGALRDLKFATYTFENNSQGKFMLSIMFGQSKYYSDALSENVKRGNQTKLERGWRPNRAPLGYRNDAATKTILPDPVHFPLVRRMFEMFLSGSFSPRQIALTARDVWGFRTPISRRSGGKPIALSTVYRILGNRFYTGMIPWNGGLYAGAHTAVVTPDEFARVQVLLKRQGQPRPQKHVFAFTGLIRCGSCGMRVTAEIKTNPYGSRYTYYHCTRRGLEVRCREASITAADMTLAFAAFLASLTISPEIEHWVYRHLDAEMNEEAVTNAAAEASRAASTASIDQQLKELTRLRLRQLMTDEEFVEERERLQGERASLLQASGTSTVDRFELFDYMVSFSKYAVHWFLRGDPALQRFIIQIVGSNFILAAKKLCGEAVKPFRICPENVDFSVLCGVVKDVRTSGVTAMPSAFGGAAARSVGALRLYRDIQKCADLPETHELLQNLKQLHLNMDVAVGSRHPRTSGGTSRGGSRPSSAPHRGQAYRQTKRRKYG